MVVYHGTKAEFAIFDASHNHKAKRSLIRWILMALLIV
ncbi:MAG: hypothetical protein II360_06465 [Muribaculaceae bacterium]|nr:hypothetical protein [Muribaculaceae bacterium]